MVFVLYPQFRLGAIVRTGGMARLSSCGRSQAMRRIGQVHYHPIGRQTRYHERTRSARPCRSHRPGAPGCFEWSHIEQSGQRPIFARRMGEAARAGYALATDIADYLVAKGLPFREAHGVVAALSDQAADEGGDRRRSHISDDLAQ